MANDQAVVSIWPTEAIPDNDLLYYRVHINNAPDGVLHPGVFREQSGSMSTDWSKFSTPEATRLRAKSGPAVNGVMTLHVGGVRSVSGLTVDHNPLDSNQAHTDVKGIEAKHGTPPEVQRVRIRSELFQRFNTWTIPPDGI